MNEILTFSFYILENYLTVDIVATGYREAYNKMLKGLDKQDMYFELNGVFPIDNLHNKRYMVG